MADFVASAVRRGHGRHGRHAGEFSRLFLFSFTSASHTHARALMQHYCVVYEREKGTPKPLILIPGELSDGDGEAGDTTPPYAVAIDLSPVNFSIFVPRSMQPSPHVTYTPLIYVYMYI